LRDPPRLVFGEQLSYRSPARLILEIDVSELLAVGVAHDKAGFQLLDRPGRRETFLEQTKIFNDADQTRKEQT
jgi:hypothetical protein